MTKLQSTLWLVLTSLLVFIGSLLVLPPIFGLVRMANGWLPNVDQMIAFITAMCFGSVFISIACVIIDRQGSNMELVILEWVYGGEDDSSTIQAEKD